jgi:2-oxo-3-hexenedioate decarboxylase
MTSILKLAEILDDATVKMSPIEKLTTRENLTLDQGYQIQKALVDRRLARGETMIGVKMGMTNSVMRAQLGLDDAVWGRLTSDMRVADGNEVPFIPAIFQRVEPEVVFLLKKPLSGAVSPAEAMSAVDAIAPAIEIIGTRYRDHGFTLVDAVADDVSAFGVVVGAWNNPDQDLSNLGMVLEFDGRVTLTGSSAAIMGHPARSLAAAARMAASAELELKAGWIVLAGSATVPAAIQRGTYVKHSVQGLGTAEFRVSA